MKKLKTLCIPLMFGAALMSQSAAATDNLTFRGKLVIPTCTLNGSAAEVDWGDIEIQNLVANGGNDKKFILNFTCPYHENNLKMTIKPTQVVKNGILVPGTSDVANEGLLVYLFDSASAQNDAIGTALTPGVQFQPKYLNGASSNRNVTLHAQLGYVGALGKLKAGTFSVVTTLVATYE